MGNSQSNTNKEKWKTDNSVAENILAICDADTTKDASGSTAQVCSAYLQVTLHLG